jgi:hypothetical protein
MEPTKLIKKVLFKIKQLESAFQELKQPQLEDYISEFDAKKHLSKGTTWFWNLKKSGFPYSKLCGEVYYRRQDFVDLLEKNMRGGATVDF